MEKEIEGRSRLPMLQGAPLIHKERADVYSVLRTCKEQDVMGNISPLEYGGCTKKSDHNCLFN